MDDVERSERPAYRHLGPGAITARRVAVRFAVLALALIAVDLAVASTFPAGDYEADWRMPRELPTSQLAPFVEHVERTAASDQRPAVVFLGASPAWGEAVAEASQTVPAAYEREALAAGSDARVYNLASNGQLLGDVYFVARRVADDTDLLVVQLNYHGFNGEWRRGAKSRYPELPALLGVPVDDELASALEIEPSRRPDIAGDADRWLRAHWGLYGARDSIAASAFGATPEKQLFERWELLTTPDFAGEEDVVQSGRPFEELDPDQQMRVLDEFAAAADFELDPRDSEVRMLERLSADLAASKTRTVFYISPLNIEALESFDMLDRERYAANVAPLRKIVEANGHRFLDLNEDSDLPASAFADINHTTAEGSELVAAELWRRTQDSVVAP